jgi:hypothetical protein
MIYKKSKYEEEKRLNWLGWSLLLFMVIFYPMLTSIYGILPPLIGVVGLMVIYNVDENRVYAFLGMLYLVNLDLNLSLPMLLSIFSIVIIYVMIYPSAKLMIRCQKCLAFFLIFLINGFYYINLFIYDIIFSSKVIVGDNTLLFYILFDLLIGLFV